MNLAVALALLGSLAPPTIPEVIPEGCPNPVSAHPCTWSGGPIYMPSAVASRTILYHEMGHQFDYQVLTDTDRDRFRQLVGDPRPWRSEPNSPNEQFAEAYRLCVVPQAETWKGRVEASYHYLPRIRRHQRICALIWAAAVIR